MKQELVLGGGLLALLLLAAAVAMGYGSGWKAERERWCRVVAPATSDYLTCLNDPPKYREGSKE